MAGKRLSYGVGIALIAVVAVLIIRSQRRHPPNLSLLHAALAHTERVLHADGLRHHALPHGAHPALDLVHNCDGTAPEPITRARRARARDIAIIARFADAAAATHAANTIRAGSERREWVLAFGQTLLVSQANSAARAERVRADVEALGGDLLASDRDTARDFDLSIACTAPDESAASHLFDEIDGYAWAPPRSTRVPWASHHDRSPAQLAADRRARATYRALTRHLARELSAANVPLLARRHLRATQRREHETAARTHRRLLERKQAAVRKAEEALRAETALHLDHDLIERYLDHHDEHHNGRLAHDWYGWTTDVINPNAAADRHPGVTRDHRAPAARIAYVARHGRTVHLHGVDFFKTQVGLPALASYLCAQGCSDIRYALFNPKQDEATQSAMGPKDSDVLVD